MRILKFRVELKDSEGTLLWKDLLIARSTEEAEEIAYKTLKTNTRASYDALFSEKGFYIEPKRMPDLTLSPVKFNSNFPFTITAEESL
jgi:hypothetical protein